MKRNWKILLLVCTVLALIAGTILLIATRDIPVLDPEGVIARKEKDLLVTTALLMVLVLIPVFGFTLFFAYRYREGKEGGSYEPNWEHNYLAECFWWGIPVFIILILSILTWKTTHDLDPFKPLSSDKPAVPIQVVALQWKWLFIYPEEGIATLNYVQFPEKTPIDLTLTSDAPMNSFWIPRLGGQIYAMSGMRSQLHLMADREGSYRGSSAHLSGAQFADMVFEAKVSSEEEYASWVEEVRSAASSLTFAQYEDLAKPGVDKGVGYYTVDPDLFEEILGQYTRSTRK